MGVRRERFAFGNHVVGEKNGQMRQRSKPDSKKKKTGGE